MSQHHLALGLTNVFLLLGLKEGEVGLGLFLGGYCSKEGFMAPVFSMLRCRVSVFFLK